MTGWAALAAISISIIAVVMVVFAMLWIFWFAKLQRNMFVRLDHIADWMEQEARPTLLTARVLLEDSAKLAALLREHSDEFSTVAKDVRTGLERVRETAEERLHDLDALLEVVQEEVEDTVLDFASALRTTRRGVRVFRTMKRAFLGRGR